MDITQGSHEASPNAHHEYITALLAHYDHLQQTLEALEVQHRTLTTFLRLSDVVLEANMNALNALNEYVQEVFYMRTELPMLSPHFIEGSSRIKRWVEEAQQLHNEHMGIETTRNCNITAQKQVIQQCHTICEEVKKLVHPDAINTTWTNIIHPMDFRLPREQSLSKKTQRDAFFNDYKLYDSSPTSGHITFDSNHDTLSLNTPSNLSGGSSPFFAPKTPTPQEKPTQKRYATIYPRQPTENRP